MTLFRVFALVSLMVPSPVAAPTQQCETGRVFAQLRAATGGHRWSDFKEIVADGVITDSDATGSFHMARDLAAGQSSFSESLDQGRVAYVYDGRTAWERDQGLGVHALDADESSARAITDAYMARNGFWNGSIDPAHFDCTSGVSTDGRLNSIIRVTPRGGSEVDVWIDRSTHLIDRTVQELPTSRLTRIFGDYREVSGLDLPFNIVERFTDSYGNPAITSQRITSYELRSTTRPSDFLRPPDPENGRFLNRATETTIPFSLDKGVIVFDARLNGLGPFSFTFDPGAQGALTSIVSRPLGLRIGKMTNVRHVRIGDAEIDNISLPVYGGKPTDSFPERDPSKSAIAGSLGPELLDRFAVRLDYATQTMTLAPPRGFRCNSPGVSQHFTMQQDDDIPLIPAIIDGHAGRLQFDVRAPTSLLLFRPFLEKTALAFRYPAERGSVDVLVLGGVTLHAVPARFVAARVGKFASHTEAGLAGSRLLSQFTTTLDYQTQTICFERRQSPH